MAASLATLWSVWFPACLGEASAQQIVSTHVSASVHVSCDLNSASTVEDDSRICGSLQTEVIIASGSQAYCAWGGPGGSPFFDHSQSASGSWCVTDEGRTLLGNFTAAKQAYAQAIGLTKNPAVRDFLQRRGGFYR